jgi:uncharacterized SAM-binding protein YcdF (DUF218 family)
MFEHYPVKALAELLVLPPSSLFVLFVAGLWIARRRARLGRAVQLAAVLSLYLLSLPAIAGMMLRTLEQAAPLDIAALAQSGAGAIVVLSAEATTSPEYGGATLGGLTLERVRYAARLAHASGLPVLVTGGALGPGQPPIALIMSRVLEQEFGVAVRWVEDRAQTTDENARFSAAILRRAGIGTVVLVTHAFHMKRAVLAFTAAGIDAVAAPTMFTPHDAKPDAFLPSAKALEESFFAAHEWIGLVWYRLNYAIAGAV